MTLFLRDTALLLGLRWQMAWNSFRARSRLRQALYVLVAITAGSSIVTFCGTIGYAVGRLLLRYPDLRLDALLPGLILTVPAVLLLAVAFGVALGSLFLSGDLEVLMVAPVDRRAVLAAKLLDGLAWYYALLAVAALPALVTYGSGLGYGAVYYVLTVVCLLAVPLLPAGLAALLVMAAARVAPARRVREALGLAVALLGASCSIAGQTARLWTRQLAFASGDPREVLIQLHSLGAAPLPTLVAGRGLAAAGRGAYGTALAEVSGYLALTLGAFALCLLTADTLYATGWTRMQSAGTARRRHVARNDGGWLGRAPAALAICLKDWRVIPRDLRNFAQLVTPLLVLPAIYVNLLGGRTARRNVDVLVATSSRLGAAAGPVQGALTAAGILLVAVLVFGRVARTSIGREGRSWWVVKAAPVNGVELLGGKLLAAAIPFALVSTAMLVVAAAWNHYSLAGALYGWYGIQVLGITMLAFNVAFGVPWARLDWDDPRYMASGWASVWSLGTSFVAGVVGGALLALPLIAESVAPALAAPAWAFGAGATLAIGAGASALAIQYGAARLRDVGEA